MKKKDSSPGFYVIMSPGRRALSEAREAFSNRNSTPPGDGTPAIDDKGVFKLIEALEIVEENQSRMSGELAEMRHTRGKIDVKQLFASVGVLSVILGAAITFLGWFVDGRINTAVASIKDANASSLGIIVSNQAVATSRIDSTQSGYVQLKSQVDDTGRRIATIEGRLSVMRP